MKKAVFIDKDGTLIKNVPYNIDPALVSLEESAGEALYLLKNIHFYLIIISNQSGVAHGFFTENALEKINAEIQYQLSPFGVKIDAFYYCPHFPNSNIKKYSVECNCRKPMPGLLLKAAKDYDIDIGNSWMIGDILNDVEAGNVAGCRTILLDNGNETEWVLNEKRTPGFKVNGLMQAAGIIIKEEKDKVEKYGRHLAPL